MHANQSGIRVSNLGGTFPKFFILRLVDFFTSATCLPPSTDDPLPDMKKGAVLITESFSCALQSEKERCKAGGGYCDVKTDGYYITNILCVMIGLVTFYGFIRKAVLHLQGLPLRSWRLSPGTGNGGLVSGMEMR